MDDLDLLQLHTDDDALRDDDTKAAIEAIVIDNYRNPEQKNEGLLHFREVTRLIETVVPVFDTMESHYEELQKIGIDQPLPPWPDKDEVFRPDLFSGEIRGKIIYYNSIVLNTVGNLELYGEIQDMTAVFNAMVEVYLQNRHKMNEMSGRIRGSSDRYTALYKDLAVMRTHITELAKTLQFYCKHYPKDELPHFSETRKEPLELQRKILLLKHFQVFEKEKEQKDQGEAQREESSGNELKLMSLEGAISISQLLQDIARSAKKPAPKLAKIAGRLKRDWEYHVDMEKFQIIFAPEDKAPFVTRVFLLEEVRTVLVKARSLTEPTDIGTRIDVNIDRINETLAEPNVTKEEATGLFKEAFDRAAARMKQEKIRNQREIIEVEALIEEEKESLEDAKREGRNEEVERLSKEVQNLRTQVDRLKEKEKIATTLEDSEKREKLAADLFALALGRKTADPLASALASGDPMILIVAGITVGLLFFSRSGFLLSEQSNGKKRKRK